MNFLDNKTFTNATIVILLIVSILFIILYFNKPCPSSVSRSHALKPQLFSNKKLSEYKPNPLAKYAIRVGTVPVVSNITKHGKVVNIQGAQHLAKVKNLPAEWDWRNTGPHMLYPGLPPGNYCSDVKNQHAAPAGSDGMQYTGTCWIFSSVQTMADRINIMNGVIKGNNVTPKVDLSVQPVLSCSGSDIGILTGGDSYTCYDIIMNTTKGLVDTTCMPFLGDNFKDMCQPECATCLPVGENKCSDIGETHFTSYGNNRCCGVNHHNKYHLEGFSNISARFTQEVQNGTIGWSDNDTLKDYVKTEILTCGPVTLAVDAMPIEINDGKNIFVKRSSASYTPQLDHLISIVGWGTYSGGDYWIIRNSWGTSYANQGYVYVDTQSIGMDDPSNNFFGSYPTGFSKALGIQTQDENIRIQQTG